MDEGIMATLLFTISISADFRGTKESAQRRSPSATERSSIT